MNKEEIMNLAARVADETMSMGYGGPFGAVITDMDGNVIATGSNRVIIDNDPTAHGEIVCIRNACKKLNTHDLSGYVLYTTAYPCPMCLSAIMWANIKKVYYGCSVKDTRSIGFRDEFMYNFLDVLHNKPEEYLLGPNANVLSLQEVGKSSCKELFTKYESLKTKRY